MFYRILEHVKDTDDEGISLVRPKMHPNKKFQADALKPSEIEEDLTDEIDLVDEQKTIQSNNIFCVLLTIFL
jgi:hypothetical protein